MGDMLVHLLKSKIHRATVTESNLHYEGSLTIDRNLMDAAELIPHEKILCANLANGERFETYVIPARRGSSAVVLNGATAHLGKVGDRLTIMSFAWVKPSKAKKWKPRVLVLGKQNALVSERKK